VLKRVLGGAVLPIALSAAALDASGAGLRGVIAFNDVRMDFELVVRNADGTGEHRVLSSLDSELDPSLSPDGTASGWRSNSAPRKTSTSRSSVRTEPAGERLQAARGSR
jgi:hypothetical protein